MNARLVALLVLAAPVPILAQTTELVSIPHTGTGLGGDAFASAVSADGTRVAFTSNAWNVVPGYDSGTYHVYVRDLTSGVTQIASVDSNGVGGDNLSTHGRLSADGQFVSFVSFATNLVAGDTNVVSDVFVRDLFFGTTERVSVGSTGLEGDADSVDATISGDGRFVVFASRSDFGLVGDQNGAELDVFLKDRLTGNLERISISGAGAGGDAASGSDNRGLAITPDGRYVAFSSVATNLVPGDTNGDSDIFVRDRLLGTTQRVSVATGGGQVNAGTGFGSFNPAISDDGRYVAFDSGSNEFTPLDTDVLGFDIFVHDVQTGMTTFVSEAVGGPLELPNLYPGITADGRQVVFQNGAGSGQLWHIWVRDVQTGNADLVSQSTAGVPADDDSLAPTISADGTCVAFDSYARNLAPNTSSFNTKVFLRRRPLVGQYDGYCYGDGSSAACPCANESVPGQQQGCRHSLGTGGQLAGEGRSDATADTFVLVGSNLPNSFGLFFQGTSRVNGGLGVAFGDGLRCAGGNILRLRVKPIAGGTARYPDTGDAPISVLAGLSAGDVRTYQIWFRNAAAFCTSATFNLTNGIEVVW